MTFDLRPWAAVAALCLVACDPQPVDGGLDEESLELMTIITNGSPADDARYDAVVSMHEPRWRGNGLDPLPFCTGTLISDTVVLTAAHCVDVARYNARNPVAMDPDELGIHIGATPTAGLQGDVYATVEVLIHPQYDRRDLYNDIALIRLASPVVGVDPIPALPTSLGFSRADRLVPMDFVGFGRTWSTDGGDRLHVQVPLRGLGCAVAGCSDPGDRTTQISYRQEDGGPCQGDSGGPMLVERNGQLYVGGITSYGDGQCRRYGVSTKVDAFESWIAAF